MAIKKILNDSKVMEAGKGSDTIRIWESFRDQAILWRSLALLQIPTTLIALLFAFVIWETRSVTLNVPPKPLPGQYPVQQIPDIEFIDAATEFVNLIATYQSIVARKQFNRAAEMVVEPFLETFRREMLDQELKAIETTGRTQVFFVDPTYTKIERGERQQVVVSMRGSALKLVAGKELPETELEFKVTMSTVPKTSLNPYGIVVTATSADKVKR